MIPPSIVEWGIEFVVALQAIGDWLIFPMSLATFMGNTEFYLLLLPAIYWCIDRHLGIRVGVVLMLNSALFDLLKMTFHDPRPYWYDLRVRLIGSGESSFGLPSGHAQNAIVFWGLIAAYIQKWWFWLIAIFIAATVGLSRAFLGVHFPTDILGGWALGIIVLILILWLEAPFLRWFNRYSTGMRIAMVFVFSLVLVMTAQLVVAMVSSGWQLPNEWIINAQVADPDEAIGNLNIGSMMNAAGGLFGIAGGVIWLNARGAFDPGGPILKRFGRYLLGLVGVVVIWFGLGALIDSMVAHDSIVDFVLSYVIFGLVGLWVTALAPLIFMKIGWADRLPNRASKTT